MAGAQVVLADLAGEQLLKQPGSVNGESVALRNLSDCSVYILDNSSEVEVQNCRNCQLFIGPVDGPAIFEGCTNCQVSVACQQFQAKACSGVEFGLFCATAPSISGSNGIRFACWQGAYPGLTGHFAAARLDPKSNNWSNVYDASAPEEGAGPANFEVVTEAGGWWEVPLEGAGTPENPVPGPDGEVYGGGADAAAVFESHEPEPAAAAPPANGLIDDDFLAEGGVALPAGGSAADDAGLNGPGALFADGGDNPAQEAAREAISKRLAEQTQREAEGKAATQAAAMAYLQAYYEKRQAAKGERIRAGREASGQGLGEHGPVGDTPWQRAVSLINFGASRPAGASDLSRFKQVLQDLAKKGKGGGTAA